MNIDNKSESVREEFWKTASESENIALLARIARLKAKGIDIEGLFDMVDPDIKET